MDNMWLVLEGEEFSTVGIDPSAKRVKINVNECMEFLTKNTDAHVILKDDFIDSTWEHIE